jgi:hypothetical protein
MEMAFQLNMDIDEFCKVADGIVNEQHTNAHLIVTKHKKCVIKCHYLLHRFSKLKRLYPQHVIFLETFGGVSIEKASFHLV